MTVMLELRGIRACSGRRSCRRADRRRAPYVASRVSQRLEAIESRLYYSIGANDARRLRRKTLAFLRALKRNNDREWFRARKDEYEQHVRGPMVELLARLAADFRDVRARAGRPTEACRSTASTATRASAATRRRSRRTSPRTFRRAAFRAARAPGLYLEVAPGWVWIGGGLYMPSSPDLQAIREHIAATHPRAASDRHRRRRSRRRSASSTASG